MGYQIRRKVTNVANGIPTRVNPGLTPANVIDPNNPVDGDIIQVSAIIVGFSVANMSNPAVTVTIDVVHKNTSIGSPFSGHIVPPGTPIDPGSSLVVAGGSQKVGLVGPYPNLLPNPYVEDEIEITPSGGSVDVVLTVVELTKIYTPLA